MDRHPHGLTAPRRTPDLHAPRRAPDRHGLRRAPDLDALRAAPDPWTLAHRALVPAVRNLGLAIRLLPAGDRDEATAAVLACRVLDAFEDLGGAPARRHTRLTAATGYLTGRGDPPPTVWPAAVATRDSERVDLVLAERIVDVRALIVALPRVRRDRVTALVADLGAAMAEHLAAPGDRDAYGGRVLGRAVQYACELVAPGAGPSPEVCATVGRLLQLCNDLRDGDREPASIVRVPALALVAFALLRDLGTAVTSRGARAATAYMAITTSAFLCRRAGASPAYPRMVQLAAALGAGRGPGPYADVLRRVAEAADRAMLTAVGGAGSRVSLFAAGGDLTDDDPLVRGAVRLVGELPAGALDGDPSPDDALRLLLADHLAFQAVDAVADGDGERIRALADRVRRAAIDGATA